MGERSTDAELVEAVAQFVEGRVSLSGDPTAIAARLRALLARAEAAEAVSEVAREYWSAYLVDETENADLCVDDHQHELLVELRDLLAAPDPQPQAPVMGGDVDNG